MDALGAFCGRGGDARRGSGQGPLAGLTFALKDVFDLEGDVTGCGNPEWLRTHEPAAATAPTVRRLLEAGADLVGKVLTDEMTYSLNGENVHYGTPLNSRAPDRIPGGSSSGSAAAVAGGAVDFALGTDCGGSVRLPASYCGLFGLRPSHGRVSMEGSVPLAPSFDTAGWFAREPEVLELVGDVLLEGLPEPVAPRRLIVARDLFSAPPPEVSAALAAGLARVADGIGEAVELDFLGDFSGEAAGVFKTVQAGEAWAGHGGWIESHEPRFGPGVRDRFAAASKVGAGDVAAARARRGVIAAHLQGLLPPGTFACLPTAPGIAPLRGTPPAELESFRSAALNLLCAAGIAGLPQISLPLAELEGCPLGLSLIAGRDQDRSLLRFARLLFAKGA